MDENNADIKELWLKGFTGSQIAAQLSVTRNSVMGKLHRMRHSGVLSGKALDERMKSINTVVKKKNNEDLTCKKKLVEKKNENNYIPRQEPVEDLLNIIMCEEVIVEQTSNPITFDRLTPKSCRFIINNGNPKDFLFCGNPKKGRSYCDKHERICYYRPIKKDP